MDKNAKFGYILDIVKDVTITTRQPLNMENIAIIVNGQIILMELMYNIVPTVSIFI